MGSDRWNHIVIGLIGMWAVCGNPRGLPKVYAQNEASRPSFGPVADDAEFELQALDASGHQVPLPAPPDDLATWIRRGKVRLEFYEPSEKPRSFDGETRFEYRYDYRCRSEWKRVRIKGKAGLEIRVTYSDVTLEMTHLILLPQKMASNVFDQPLTKHEFDHVRISAQPGLDKLLRSMLVRRNSKIRHVLDAQADEFSSQPTEADLKRISHAVVSKQSDLVFDDFAELIKIRYRELDRVSRYGIQSLSLEERQRMIESPIQESTASEDPQPQD